MAPRAQPGEGIVIVLDVGPSVRASTSATFLSQSKKCLINILQRKMFAEKCRDLVGVVLFGTDETDNTLATENSYQHVKVLQGLLPVTWDVINEVEEIKGGRTSGDWLDALVVAMTLLHDPNDERINVKKIVLLTDFSGEFTDSETEKIVNGLKTLGIELSVIGPEIMDADDDETMDSDDDAGPSNGFKNNKIKVSQNWNGKPKTAVQLAGEALITRIVSEVDGIICSFDEAIPQLIFFQKKSQGSANWNTVLDVGPCFQIAITGRIKVKQAALPTWKREYAHDSSSVIIKETSYHRNDDAQTSVEADEVIAGYKYGSTLVPFSDEDAQMKYNSDHPRCLSILGFTRSSNVAHHSRAGDQVLVVTAREGDEAGARALSAFIQALVEMDYVGITRRIYNKNNNPQLGVLFPEVTGNYECLVWIPLPFQEDVRSYTFPSLQKVTEKLSESEAEAMDELITSMDLTSKEEGDDEELLEPSSVLNPQIQHFFNVLTHRSIHENKPLPSPAEHVLNILKPPNDVLEGRDACSKALAKLFPTKIVQKNKRKNEDIFTSNGEESNKKQQKQNDNDDSISASDLTSVLVSRVSSATPVEDFNALLRGETPDFNLICEQMGDVILQLLENVGGSGPSSEAIISKILDCLIAFRRESLIIDPSPYNKFMSRLKDAVTLRLLQSLWNRIKDDNLGQITSEESLKSDVSVESATTFLQLESQSQPAASEPKQEEDDMEDLLDDL